MLKSPRAAADDGGIGHVEGQDTVGGDVDLFEQHRAGGFDVELGEERPDGELDVFALFAPPEGERVLLLPVAAAGGGRSGLRSSHSRKIKPQFRPTCYTRNVVWSLKYRL